MINPLLKKFIDGTPVPAGYEAAVAHMVSDACDSDPGEAGEQGASMLCNACGARALVNAYLLCEECWCDGHGAAHDVPWVPYGMALDEGKSTVYKGYRVEGINSDGLRITQYLHQVAAAPVVGNMEYDNKFGLYLGTTKKFVIDYYSLLTDREEILLTYRYMTGDVIQAPCGKHSELRVRKARLVAVELLQRTA